MIIWGRERRQLISHPELAYSGFNGTRPSGFVTVSRIPSSRPQNSMMAEERATMYKVSSTEEPMRCQMSGAKEAMMTSHIE